MVSEISVIIPAYNRASLIGETLRSLLNQTVPAKEIIVVDDGSTDGTAEKTLEAFENWKLETGSWKNDDGEQVSANSTSSIQHPTFKILRQANAGPGAARNRGLAEATGEFIHFFDSDDIAAPNKHEVQLRALLETGADIAYGPWCKGRFVNLTTEDITERLGGCEVEQPKVDPKGDGAGATESKEKAVLRLGKPTSAAFSNPSPSALARDSENPSPARSASGPAEALDARRWSLDAGPWNFVPEGPVLQARGLPKGDLVHALLTNWSIVPHACLFRKSIVEKAGAFPEELFGTEDQLMFLRCLLAGAMVVHTPGTFELYRVGVVGKITATGNAQQRHAKEWARFLIKANQEVKEKAETLKSEVVKAPATSYSLPVTHQPSAWFRFRLRAYEAWRDLGRFFPEGEGELKNELRGIWKKNRFSVFSFQFSGFVLRKLGGLKQRVLGYREHASFRCGKFSSFIDFGGQ